MGIKLRHLLFSICLLGGCSKHPSPQVIMPSNIKLQAGDVVFRRGNGTISRSITYVDNNGKYSHVGIVVDSAGTFMIIHAVPNEPDYKGDVDKVKMDSPQQFFSSSKASKGEICRIEDSIIARKASLVAMNIYKRNTLFDHDYNVEDTTKMYCTELVMYAFRQAGLNLVEGEGQSINLPFLHTTCYFPSDVYYSNSLNSIVKFKNKIIMRKIVFIAFGVLLFIACSNSNTPKSVAEKSIKCIIDEDFDGYVDLLYFNESKMKDPKQLQSEKELCADLLKSKYYDKDDSLHIKEYKFISEEIKDSIAIVKFELVNKKGEKDTTGIKLKINCEGNWRITRGH